MEEKAMSMSKKDFIALANAIRDYNQNSFPHGTNTVSPLRFTHTQLIRLADFCHAQNYRFNRDRWLAYIAGECGPNGGKR
jgi:hypothetical protein